VRADRLISILLLLQNQGRLTAGQIAKRLEVSERTVHRDMSVLGSAGVPVVADRGAGGGWSLMPGYRANLSSLNEAEVRALFLGTPASLLHDLRLDHASDAAALKLLSALPSVSRRAAERARQRIHIDLTGWKLSRDPVPMLPVVQDAVWSDRKLRFAYNDRERVVDPIGLVAKGSVWYLVAQIEGAVRTYRVSRIQDASILDEPGDPPPDFDLAKYWEQSAAEFKEKLPRYAVVLRGSLSIFMHGMIRYGAIDSIDGDVVRMHFDAEEAALVTLLGFGDAVQVIEPAALREKVVAAARATVARYDESNRPAEAGPTVSDES
jgi:predicted DNA-binding transcriptional regulator YafY